MVLQLIRTNEIEQKKSAYSHQRTFNHIILYKKSTFLSQITDESALIRNFLRNGRVRGLTDRAPEGSSTNFPHKIIGISGQISALLSVFHEGARSLVNR